jgi:transcriptional regulator with XRE-family HTH domain
MTIMEYLKAKDLTFSEFAAMIGVKTSSVHRYAHGLAIPRPATAQKIIQVTKQKVKLEDIYNAA